MGEPTKIVWLTDLHIGAHWEGSNIDLARNLAQIVRMIRRYHSDAAACVISGDLTESGGEAEYDALTALLSDIQVPLLAMIGNHDRRDALMSAFPPPGRALEGFQQYRVDVGGLSVIALDTHIPGEPGGMLCETRRAWLADELARTPDTPVLVFMHHPPVELGLPMLDAMRCADGEEILDLMAGAGNVAHLFCGHVHRPTSGVARGVPFATLRAVSMQAPPPWPAWDWEGFKPVDEMAQMGVILADQRDVVIHALDLTYGDA